VKTGCDVTWDSMSTTIVCENIYVPRASIRIIVHSCVNLFLDNRFARAMFEFSIILLFAKKIEINIYIDNSDK